MLYKNYGQQELFNDLNAMVNYHYHGGKRVITR